MLQKLGYNETASNNTDALCRTAVDRGRDVPCPVNFWRVIHGSTTPTPILTPIKTAASKMLGGAVNFLTVDVMRIVFTHILMTSLRRKHKSNAIILITWIHNVLAHLRCILALVNMYRGLLAWKFDMLARVNVLINHSIGAGLSSRDVHCFCVTTSSTYIEMHGMFYRALDILTTLPSEICPKISSWGLTRIGLSSNTMTLATRRTFGWRHPMIRRSAGMIVLEFRSKLLPSVYNQAGTSIQF